MNATPDLTPHYAEPASNESLGTAVAYLLEVLRRRKWVILGIAALVIAGAATASMLVKPRYIAVAQVKIDPNQNAMIGINVPKAAGADDGLIDTEVRIIQSRDIALIVADRLKLYDDPEFAPRKDTSQFRDARQLRAAQVEAAAQSLLGALSVEREKLTYVVNISVRSTNATKAANIANAFAEAYLSNSLGSRTSTASRQAAFLNERLKAAGTELARLEQQAAEYKAQAGVIGSNNSGGYSSTVSDEQLGSISSQLASAEAAASAAQASLDVSRRQLATGGIDAVSASMNSPVITNLRGQRAEVARNLGEVEVRYGPRHPEMVRVTNQLKQIDDEIDQEARRVMGGLASEAAAANAKAANLRGRMNELRAVQSDSTRSGALAQSAQQQADGQRQVYNRLAAETQQAVQLSRNTQTQAQVIEAAVPPGRPAYPNRQLFILFGVAAGLGLGVAVAGLQEILGKGMRTAHEVRNQLGLALLASIPRVSGKGRRANPADVLIDRPVTPFGEAFRVVRNRLLHSSRREQAKVVVVVSPLPNEGKTTSVLGLARTMAMSGDRVLLIDGDVRKAGLSRIVAADATVGLVEILHNESAFDDAVCRDLVPKLDVLPVANPLLSAEDLFGSGRMAALLEDARQRYDRILIDTPPFLGVADARVLANLADSVVLAIRWNVTPAKSAYLVTQELRAINAHVAGVMFTMVDPRSEEIGGMYYSKEYTRYYQSA